MSSNPSPTCSLLQINILVYLTKNSYHISHSAVTIFTQKTRFCSKHKPSIKEVTKEREDAQHVSNLYTAIIQGVSRILNNSRLKTSFRLTSCLAQDLIQVFHISVSNVDISDRNSTFLRSFVNRRSLLVIDFWPNYP